MPALIRLSITVVSPKQTKPKGAGFANTDFDSSDIKLLSLSL
jgi:hypothetical protein